jgi:hypothetical protein
MSLEGSGHGGTGPLQMRSTRVGRSIPMKSSISTILVLCALSILHPDTARAQAFNVGDNVIGVGLGIGGHYRAYGSYSTVSPAWNLQFEHAATTLGDGVLGVGGYLGYKTMGYRSRASWWGGPGYEYNYRWTYLIMGARAAWHYNTWHGVEELDTYGGLMLSYNSISYRDDTRYPLGVYPTYSSTRGGLLLTAFVGARYYFTPQLAAQMELGYGVSVISIGLAYKF